MQEENWDNLPVSIVRVVLLDDANRFLLLRRGGVESKLTIKACGSYLAVDLNQPTPHPERLGSGRSTKKPDSARRSMTYSSSSRTWVCTESIGNCSLEPVDGPVPYNSAKSTTLLPGLMELTSTGTP